jgi:hypothetical protein
MKFSEKYGYVSPKKIQIESMDEVLRNRLINEIRKYLNGEFASAEIKYIIDKFGMPIDKDGFEYIRFNQLLNETKDPWYMLYDIIDYCFTFENEKVPVYQNREERKQIFSYKINKILEEEKAGYRLVNEEVAPITNPTEIAAIEQASSTEFDAINVHISKALNLYADRHKPDYENSIKESISAIESICCIITGLSGAQATLGKALKKLTESGIEIHPAMESAFEKLFGYTCDGDKGIRHAGINFEKAPEEDAKFMLVSCSAFVNYLMEKYAKIKGE